MVVPIPLGNVGGDLLLGEIADRGAERLVLFRELEHDAPWLLGPDRGRTVGLILINSTGRD
jgi:hypothetical protein